MFKFKKIIFIVFNFFVSLLTFVLIYNIRYSWINFVGVEKRVVDFSTLFFFFSYSLVFIIFLFAFKIYEVNLINNITASLPSIIFSTFLSIAFFSIFFYITKLDFARFVFFSGFFTLSIAIPFINKLIFIFLKKSERSVKFLFFGSKKNYQIFIELVNKYKKWLSVNYEMFFQKDPILLLKDKMKNNPTIIIDTDCRFDKEELDLLHEYEVSGGKIYTLVDIFDYLDQSLPVEIIENNHYANFSYLKIDSFYNRYIKRILDIIISLFLLVLFSPLMLFIAILIKITTKGSIFFKQQRVTINNKLFFLYKFRTMHDNSIVDSDFTIASDPRVTTVGKFIRPFRLDELPQLINVLKGDMSFIGPRPERPEIIDLIIKKYPLFKKRLLVKPGITGWAQVKYPYVNKIDLMNKKLSYDLYYVKNISFKLDLIILLYTIETVLFRRENFLIN